MCDLQLSSRLRSKSQFCLREPADYFCMQIASVKAAGAIILAKGTMSEWAFSAVHSIGSGAPKDPDTLCGTILGTSGLCYL